MTLSSIKLYLGNERRIHTIFLVSLWLKGGFAFSEILAGVATYAVSKQLLLGFVLWVTKDEFVEDPHDLVANFLLRSVEHLSVSAQDFAAIYLLAHGVVKLWLIVGLLRDRLGYYPTALVVFALFIAYQLYRYAFTFSIWLLAVTALDVIVIVLTWHEWRYLKTVILGDSTRIQNG